MNLNCKVLCVWQKGTMGPLVSSSTVSLKVILAHENDIRMLRYMHHTTWKGRGRKIRNLKRLGLLLLTVRY